MDFYIAAKPLNYINFFYLTANGRAAAASADIKMGSI
jgi:hypothetical protein